MRPNRLLSIAWVLVLFGIFFADSVFAGSVQYDFSYTPTTGPIQPFTFQIRSNNGFIVGEPPLGITPFRIAAVSIHFPLLMARTAGKCLRVWLWTSVVSSLIHYLGTLQVGIVL